ncbi:hypothetical protein [Rubritalea marina]|uniref:hypothetical protein n=1 Tax=Rubritalea marina TaxID=361055 RepID=UPI000370D72F|nr:hypothetical protein [Rubritalea marina]
MEPEQETSQPARRISAELLVFFVLCSFCTLGLTFWLFSGDLKLDRLHAKSMRHLADPQLHAELVEDIAIRRKRLAEQFNASTHEEEKQQILKQARALLESAAPSMMATWIGTSWDYNGMSETPGNGKIACGYYVCTVLRDLGFQLSRIKLAQQPSQSILTTFVPHQNIHITSGITSDTFYLDFQDKEPGIYIVGLDKHVGFLVHDGMTPPQFFHASARPPFCVVNESPAEAKAIIHSTYRVTGNLTAHQPTIQQWILGEPF